jgi:hypothetical protein
LVSDIKGTHRLRVPDNRVPKLDEIIGGWRKFHDDELHNLYSSPNKIRMIKSRGMRLAGHVAGMRPERNAYRILVRKPEG